MIGHRAAEFIVERRERGESRATNPELTTVAARGPDGDEHGREGKLASPAQ